MAPPPKVNTQPEVGFLNQDMTENLNLYNQWESNPHYGKQAYIISRSPYILENMLYNLSMFMS